MKSKKNIIDEQFLRKLVFDRKYRLNVNISDEYNKIISYKENKDVVERFFRKYMSQPDVIAQKEFLELTYTLDIIGDQDSLDFLIELAAILKNDRMSTDFLLESMGNIVQRLRGEIDKQIKQNLIQYLLEIIDIWRKDRRIVVYSGIAVVLERLWPNIIRKDGKEYWNYTVKELENIMTNELLKLQ